jgi:hypothetical protein
LKELFDSDMGFIEKLLGKFNGLHYRQEYLCLALEGFASGLNVYIARNGKVVKDITIEHVFAGYCPVVFALASGSDENDQLHLVFASKSFNENEEFLKKDVLAQLFFKKITERNGIVFYKAIRGQHQFLPSFNRFILDLNNSLFSKKTGNVFLKGNLLAQVQIAYSIPRKICLITIGSNNLYNLFPTDLHGQINDQFYIISLRHEGKACQQVLEAKKLVLSDMDSTEFKKVYALGKNHMQPLKERITFNFSHTDSAVFHLPIPQHAVAYKELELADSFIEGIHRILVFRIVNKTTTQEHPATLAHIHTVYATWRQNQGLQGNYLLR